MKIASLLQLLADGTKVTPEAMGGFAHETTAHEDVHVFKATKHTPVVNMSADAYQQLYAGLNGNARYMPENLALHFPQPAALGVLEGRPSQMTARSHAQKQRGRVYLPIQVLHAVQEWLDGRTGRKGIAARNALERLAYPDRSAAQPPPAPAPKPAPDRAPAPEVVPPTAAEIEGRALANLEQMFELVRLSPKKLPSSFDFKAHVADGETFEELLGDRDDVPTVYLLEDSNGYRAILVGPKLLQARERRLSRSFGSFGYYARSYTELRKTDDLEVALTSSDPLQAGRLIITVAGVDAGSLISLRLFLEFMKLIETQTE